MTRWRFIETLGGCLPARHGRYRVDKSRWQRRRQSDSRVPSAACPSAPCPTEGSTHVRHRRLRRATSRQVHHPRRPQASGVPRLRLGRDRPHRTRGHRHCARRRQPGRAVRGRGRERLAACVGLGHTRWATHGRPTEENAHPHSDCSGRVSIVLNGIVENYKDLRARLTERAHGFSSETDAEVVAHLIESTRRGPHGRGPRRSSASWTVTTPSARSRSTIPRWWSAPGRSARWSSASATTRCSSPRPSRRFCATLAG